MYFMSAPHERHALFSFHAVLWISFSSLGNLFRVAMCSTVIPDARAWISRISGVALWFSLHHLAAVLSYFQSRGELQKALGQ